MSAPTPAPVVHRTALITGATSGIGLNATRKLLARRSFTRVIVCGRSAARCSEALDLLRPSSSPATTELLAFKCDFSSLDSVETFAKEVLRALDGSALHLLVLNAGIFAGSAFDSADAKSHDGLELVMAVNHVAPALLFDRLHPALRAAKDEGGARVVLTSSEAQNAAAVPGGGRAAADWERLMKTSGTTTAIGVYGLSKLANVMMALEAQRRFSGTDGITANALHPGAIRETGIWVDQKGCTACCLDGCLVPVGRLCGTWQTVDEGGDTILACADSPTGGLYRNVHKFQPASHAIARDEAACAALWVATEAVLAGAGHPVQAGRGGGGGGGGTAAVVGVGK
jgi:NAD(P)-dependent dehydrogenase (short-subunit alcohol dehydrogenase family)